MRLDWNHVPVLPSCKCHAYCCQVPVANSQTVAARWSYTPEISSLWASTAQLCSYPFSTSFFSTSSWNSLCQMLHCQVAEFSSPVPAASAAKLPVPDAAKLHECFLIGNFQKMKKQEFPFYFFKTPTQTLSSLFHQQNPKLNMSFLPFPTILTASP